MLEDIKQTSKHAAVYVFGNIATKIIGLVLLPLYLDPKYLSEADYGALAVLEATSQLLIGLLTMAMVQSLTRWYWDAKYKDQQKSVFYTTYSFLLLTIIPAILLLLWQSDFFARILFESSEYSRLLKLTILSAGFQVLNNQSLCLAKVQSKSVLYASSQVIKLILVLGLIIWGIVVKGAGLEAIWQAYLIGEFLLFLFLIPYVWKNIQIRFNIPILKEMLIYGLPLMLASISGVLLAVTDRYMLNSMEGLEETGVYSLGLRIANTLKLVISTSLAMALSPLRMKKMNEPSNQRFYSKVMTYSAYVFVLGLLALSLFSLEGIKLISGSMDYWEANVIVPIIGFALLFGLLKDNAITGLTITKNTKIIGLTLFITSILNIGLNFALIPLFQMYGASLATLLSQFFFFVVALRFSQKSYYIPYEIIKIIKLISLAAIVIFIGIAIADINIWPRLAIKLILLISFPFLLRLMRFYDAVELENILKILKELRKKEKLKEGIHKLLR